MPLSCIFIEVEAEVVCLDRLRERSEGILDTTCPQMSATQQCSVSTYRFGSIFSELRGVSSSTLFSFFSMNRAMRLVDSEDCE